MKISEEQLLQNRLAPQKCGVNEWSNFTGSTLDTSKLSVTRLGSVEEHQAKPDGPLAGPLEKKNKQTSDRAEKFGLLQISE